MATAAQRRGRRERRRGGRDALEHDEGGGDLPAAATWRRACQGAEVAVYFVQPHSAWFEARSRGHRGERAGALQDGCLRLG